jgi:flagellar basal body rod protein FlgG
MASTFFGLTIAYTGLQAAQTSINVTSHNLANINTKGYTRESITSHIRKKQHQLRLVRHYVHMLNMEHLVQELSLMQLIR